MFFAEGKISICCANGFCHKDTKALRGMLRILYFSEGKIPLCLCAFVANISCRRQASNLLRKWLLPLTCLPVGRDTKARRGMLCILYFSEGKIPLCLGFFVPAPIISRAIISFMPKAEILLFRIFISLQNTIATKLFFSQHRFIHLQMLPGHCIKRPCNRKIFFSHINQRRIFYQHC